MVAAVACFGLQHRGGGVVAQAEARDEMRRSLAARIRHIWPSQKEDIDYLFSLLWNGPYIFLAEVALITSRKKRGRKWLFSLDFHASVTSDLDALLRGKGVKVIRRVISFHNRHFRRIFRLADPSPGVNSTNWRRFTERNIARFQRVHCLLFSRVDGFLVSYPTSFMRLYLSLGKPILVVNPIRYEHPFSNRHDEWDALDTQLVSKIHEGTVTFFANNQADADYASRSLGIEVPVAPSLCDYIGARWNQQNNLCLSYAHYTTIATELEEHPGSNWRGLRSVLGDSFSWRKLLAIKELFYVPYAPSTMMLFEAATAGLPVAVPTLNFINTLRIRHPGVFSQLTFNQMTSTLPPRSKSWVASDYHDWEPFSQWWYTRSDFVNGELMPNVRFVESFDELIREPSVPERVGLDYYYRALAERNERVRKNVLQTYDSFLKKL